MGRKKEMPKQPGTREYMIWWETDQGYPVSTIIEAASEQDALKQAKEAAQRSQGKKYGIKKMTQRQFDRMMVRTCPSAAPAF